MRAAVFAFCLALLAPALPWASTPATRPRKPKLGGVRRSGVGLRVKASKAHRVNASIDFAFGEDSHAFYFYIGEAF